MATSLAPLGLICAPSFFRHAPRQGDPIHDRVLTRDKSHNSHCQKGDKTTAKQQRKASFPHHLYHWIDLGHGEPHTHESRPAGGTARCEPYDYVLMERGTDVSPLIGMSLVRGTVQTQDQVVMGFFFHRIVKRSEEGALQLL